MSKQDDERQKHEDAELCSFLDGKDGVAAAYRSCGRGEPPAALDVLILREAASVAPSTPFRVAGTGWPVLAASLCAGVLITTLYYQLSDRQPLIVQARIDQRQATELLPPAGGVPVATADVLAATTASGAETELFRIGPEGRPSGNGPPPPTRSSTVITQTELVGGDSDGREAKGLQRLLELVETERISNTTPYSYRSAESSWLDEIVRLHMERRRLTGQAAQTEDLLSEEKRRFAEAYPDVDLEAILEGP